MTKEETSSAEPMSQTTIAIIAVVALVVGFIGGYILVPQETTEGETTPVTTTPGTFSLDMAKVNNLASIFEDYYYVVSEGAQTSDFQYSTYNEYPDYVELIYIIDGTQEFPIYVSKDFTILYPSVIGVDEFKAQIEEAKATMSAPAEEPAELQPSETPEVLLFVMSFCPYGNIAEDAMDPVVDVLGETMYFEPVYIVSQTGDGGWTSLHGNVELNQGVREKIIYKLYGADVWMDYVYAVNVQCDYTNADECWKAPAEALGINTTKVEELFNNETYVDELLMKEVALTSAYGVRGSPTLIINGLTHSVARTPESYKSAICAAYLTAPEGCDTALSEDGSAATGSC